MGRIAARSVVALLVLVACCRASSTERAARPQRPFGQTGGQYLIEGEELKAQNATTLYELVRITRPFWINRTVRNTSGNDAVAVYLDERYYGPLSILREMPIHIAKRLQYLSPAEAGLRFGPSHGSRAAIHVETAKP